MFFKYLRSEERLLIWRRRQKMNQYEAANHFGISRHRFRQMENHGKSLTPEIELAVERQKMNPILPHEECLVARMRAGKSKEEVAKEMGVSHYGFYLMEHGIANTDKLRAYWGLDG